VAGPVTTGTYSSTCRTTKSVSATTLLRMLQAPVDNGQHDGRGLLCFPHLLYTIARLAWIELGDAEARALLEEPFLIAAIRVKMFLVIVFNHSIRPHSFHPRHNIHASLIHCDVILVIGNVCVALRCVALHWFLILDSWFTVCTTAVSKYMMICNYRSGQNV
jgi:hypothetical protein